MSVGWMNGCNAVQQYRSPKNMSKSLDYVACSLPPLPLPQDLSLIFILMLCLSERIWLMMPTCCLKWIMTNTFPSGLLQILIK
jgi:hypothetical protein